MLEILFWFLVFFLFYILAGYPILIAYLAKKKGYSYPENKEYQPCVTVVIAAYNAEKLIGARIDNILKQSYPSNKCNILVVSDGSSDSTNDIVMSYEETGRVELLHYKNNIGKACAINFAMQHVVTEVVVFADVRQSFSKDTLCNLLRHLALPEVGAVTGELVLAKNANKNAIESQGMYWRYEMLIRQAESKYHSLVQVAGAIYAIKKELFCDIPANTLLDDMYIPLNILRQGYRVHLECEALAFDSYSQTITEEYDRKVRTLAGNFQLLSMLPWLMNPFKNPVFMQWFSHKFCRLLMPLILLLIFVILLLLNSLLYEIFLLSYLILLVLAIMGLVLMMKGAPMGKMAIPANFLLLNIAIVKGAWVYYSGGANKAWKRH